MRIKKFFAILIAVALLLTVSLVGCKFLNPGDNNGNGGDEDQSGEYNGVVDDGQNSDDENNGDKDAVEKPTDGKGELGPDATLSDRYAWIADLSLEDIVKVYRESGGIAVAPGSPVPYAYSTDSVDIENTFALLSCKLTAISGESLQGGSYVKYVFYTSDGTSYTISIDNNRVTINGYCYMVEGFNYTFQNPYSSGDKNAPVAEEKEIIEIEDTKRY